MGTDQPESPRSLDRRRLLQTLGAAGFASIAGCSWGESGEDATTTPTATPASPTQTPQGRHTPAKDDRIPNADQYGTVVDLGDAGADRNGEESIIPHLNEHAGDDTLLYLPEGRYLMDDWWEFSPFTKFGIYGDGATIAPPEGYRGELPLLILGNGESNGLYVEGLRFDFTERGVGPSAIYTFAKDNLLVRDIAVTGTTHINRFDVTSSDGTGVVEGFRLPDGGFGKTPTGCYVGQNHRGTLTMKDCYINGFWGTGIYASNTPGTVRVIGGEFINNGIANVRVGSDALVRNVTVRCDNPPDGFRNMRGIWVLGPNATIENCQLEFGSVSGSDGAIVLGSSATVRNTSVSIDSHEINALLGNDPTRRPGRDGQVGQTTLDGVEITGNAGGGSAVTLINHDDFSAKSVSIEQSGRSRDGFRLVNIDRGSITESSVDVTGQPVVAENSSVQELDLATGRPVSRSRRQ